MREIRSIGKRIAIVEGRLTRIVGIVDEIRTSVENASARWDRVDLVLERDNGQECTYESRFVDRVDEGLDVSKVSLDVPMGK